MNWEKVKLGDYINVKTGKLDANVQVENGMYPFFTCSKDHLLIDTFSYDCECVLVAGNGDLNVKYYEGKFDAYQRTYIIESKAKNILDVRYLYHFMSKYVEKLRLDSIGGVIKYIKIGNITDAKIPLPDLATQKHIAEVLDKADALRQQNHQLLANYDELLQSTFIELFGDPVKNPKGWEVKKLGEVAENIQIGPFGSLLHQEDYVTGSIPLINPTHISQMRIFPDNNLTVTLEKYQTLKNYHLKENDVIMGRRGEMARCALVTEKEQGWLCGTGSLFIRPSHSIDSKYLVYFFSNEKTKKVLESEAQGVTMANLNTKIIKNFQFPLPPLQLQQHFAKIVEQIEAQKAQAQAALAESEALFEGLLAGYFG